MLPIILYHGNTNEWGPWYRQINLKSHQYNYRKVYSCFYSNIMCLVNMFGAVIPYRTYTYLYTWWTYSLTPTRSEPIVLPQHLVNL